MPSIKTFFSRNWLFIFLLISTPLAVLLAIAIVRQDPLTNNDFFTFWLAGRLTIDHLNVYVPDIWVGGHALYGATWIPNQAFVYPMPLSIFMIPLGLLSYVQAKVVWAFFSQLMVLLAFGLLIKMSPKPLLKTYFLPLFAGIALFRPTLVTIEHGQIGALILLLITIIVVLWQKEKWWQGCLLLPFLALKPNLGGPIILMCIFYLLVKKKARSLIAFAASGLSLIIIGMLQDSNWIVEYLSIGGTKVSETFGYSPTVWGVANLFCGSKLECTIGAGLPAILFIMAVFVYTVWRRKDEIPPWMVVSLVISCSLMLTPYIWTYDQILLVIPLVMITLELAGSGTRFLLAAPIFLMIDVACIAIFIVSTNLQTEIWNVAIPLTVSAALIWLALRKPSLHPESPSPEDQPVEFRNAPVE